MMRSFRRNLRAGYMVAILLIGLTGAMAATEPVLRLANIFNDNMVLQQGKPVTVWGWGEPGKPVTVTITSQVEAKETEEPVPPAVSLSQTVTSGADGRWRVDMEPLAASFDSHTITVKQGQHSVAIGGLLVGELWVTSGQSNMTYGNFFNKELDVPGAKLPAFRYCYYDDSWFKPKDDLKTRPEWRICSPETAGGFAAIPLLYGMRLQRILGVPVGIINHARGGTQSASWTTREELDTIALDDAIQKQDLVEFDAACAKWDDETSRNTMLDAHKAAVEAAKKDGKKAPRAPADPRSGWSPPAALYNAMVHPLRGLTVAGVLYYQGEGEGNWTERWVQYERVFPSVISTYRDTFEDEALPFGIISLAGWGDYEMEPEVSCAWGRFAVIRDIHRRTQLRTPNTGLITIYDLGNQNVHPAWKSPVADRCARWALATIYGRKIEHRGPRFKSMTVEGDKALLSFEMDPYFRFGKGERPTTGVGWQTLPCVTYGFNGASIKFTGFVIAGEDQRWWPADVKHNEKRGVLEASSPFVPTPVAVRYGWACWPNGNAIDHVTRLPLEVFRTDDWPVPATKAEAAEWQEAAKLQVADRKFRELLLGLKQSERGQELLNTSTAYQEMLAK